MAETSIRFSVPKFFRYPVHGIPDTVSGICGIIYTGYIGDTGYDSRSRQYGAPTLFIVTSSPHPCLLNRKHTTFLGIFKTFVQNPPGGEGR